MTRIVDLTIDDRRVLDAFARLIDLGESPAVMLAEIGNVLVESSQSRFVAQSDPAGRSWEPLSPTYAASEKKKASRFPDKILLLSGQMQENIFYVVDGNVLAVGSPEPYAGVMQFGARRGEFGRTSRGAPIPWNIIPARPFIGLSAEDRDEIDSIVIHHAQERINRAV